MKVGCVTKALADFDKSDVGKLVVIMHMRSQCTRLVVVEPYDVVCLVCSTYEEKVHINKVSEFLVNQTCNPYGFCSSVESRQSDL